VPPYGFIWILIIDSGLMRVPGSDALVDDRAWTRFWLLGIVQQVRPSGTTDIVRSAVGRAIDEALWVYASKTPR
jgi:hypothetical protein